MKFFRSLVFRKIVFSSIVLNVFLVAGMVLSDLGLSSPMQYAQAASLPLPPSEISLADFEQLPYKINGGVQAKTVGDAAWRSFVTLNWPSDYDGPLAEPIGYAPDAPRIWEFYKTPEAVFLPDGDDPRRHATGPLGSSLTLDLTSGQGLVGEHEFYQDLLPCFSEEKDEIACNASQLNEIPIVDQQGNYLFVETHLNPNEYQQIAENRWYDRDTLAEYNNFDKPFRLSTTYQVSPEGVTVAAPLEIKAIWRIIERCSSEQDEPYCLPPEQAARYYTTHRILAMDREQYVCDAEGESEDSLNGCCLDDPVLHPVEVGLVGFHITYKIPDQGGSPGWIWATFGQVDNPEMLSDPATCQEDCRSDVPYVRPPFLWSAQAPHAVTRINHQIQAQVPTQVDIHKQFQDGTRLDTATKSSLNLQNRAWQQSLGSVWQYYELLGTQWLQTPSLVETPPDSDRDWWSTILAPRIRSNIFPNDALLNVSEAYGRHLPKGDSCIKCHVDATLPGGNKAFSDFSFLFGRAASSSSS